MRNLCGWVLPGEIPSESTFSRAFAEFAESDIAGQMHEALVKEFVPAKIRQINTMESELWLNG